VKIHKGYRHSLWFSGFGLLVSVHMDGRGFYVMVGNPLCRRVVIWLWRPRSNTMTEKAFNGKWEAALGSDGIPVGIQDCTGRLVVEFNPADPPELRRALAKNLMWVEGCVRITAFPSEIKPVKHIPRIPGVR